MTNVQRQYLADQESARHNREMERIADQEIKIKQQTANATTQQANVKLGELATGLISGAATAAAAKRFGVSKQAARTAVKTAVARGTQYARNAGLTGAAAKAAGGISAAAGPALAVMGVMLTAPVVAALGDKLTAELNGTTYTGPLKDKFVKVLNEPAVRDKENDPKWLKKWKVRVQEQWNRLKNKIERN